MRTLTVRPASSPAYLLMTVTCARSMQVIAATVRTGQRICCADREKGQHSERLLCNYFKDFIFSESSFNCSSEGIYCIFRAVSYTHLQVFAGSIRRRRRFSRHRTRPASDADFKSGIPLPALIPLIYLNIKSIKFPTTTLKQQHQSRCV